MKVGLLSNMQTVKCHYSGVVPLVLISICTFTWFTLTLWWYEHAIHGWRGINSTFEKCCVCPYSVSKVLQYMIYFANNLLVANSCFSEDGEAHPLCPLRPVLFSVRWGISIYSDPSASRRSILSPVRAKHTRCG